MALREQDRRSPCRESAASPGESVFRSRSTRTGAHRRSVPDVAFRLGPLRPGEMPGLSGSKRYVVLHALPHFADLAHQIGGLLRVADEVDLRRVDHEQGRLLIVKEKVLIGLRYAPDVLRGDVALVIARAVAQPRDEHVGTRL